MVMAVPSYTYQDFLASLPAERRAVVAQVWPALRAAMPRGYEEQASPRLLQFVAGTEMTVALASQKNYLSLYLMPVYFSPPLQARIKAAAPKLKAGKSCLNFNQAAELPLDLIANLLRAIEPAQFLELVRASRASPHQGGVSG